MLAVLLFLCFSNILLPCLLPGHSHAYLRTVPLNTNILIPMLRMYDPLLINILFPFLLTYPSHAY
eukprot:jgi/Botrbrau1/21700/Bobra.43_1s0096.1